MCLALKLPKEFDSSFNRFRCRAAKIPRIETQPRPKLILCITLKIQCRARQKQNSDFQFLPFSIGYIGGLR